MVKGADDLVNPDTPNISEASSPSGHSYETVHRSTLKRLAHHPLLHVHTSAHMSAYVYLRGFKMIRRSTVPRTLYPAHGLERFLWRCAVIKSFMEMFAVITLTNRRYHLHFQ